MKLIQTVLNDRVTAVTSQNQWQLTIVNQDLCFFLTISFGTVSLQCLGSDQAQAAPNNIN